MERCDDDTRCLASIFSQTVPSEAIPAGKEDVFQAMLIRFRFSPHSNDYVRANYENMIGRQLTIGSHSMHALLDCEQSELIGQFVVEQKLEYALLKGLVAKMCRLGDKNLPLLVKLFLKQFSGESYQLKNLIKEGADEQYAQLVWDWIQSNGQFDTIAENCCLMPVHSLKRLMFEKAISVAAVQEMLSEVQGYQVKEIIIPKEAAILYTVMYWEAPEEVVLHFLDQLTPDCKLDSRFIRHLSQSTKYSIELWGRLAKRCQKLSVPWKTLIGVFRPDLIGLFS